MRSAKKVPNFPARHILFVSVELNTAENLLIGRRHAECFRIPWICRRIISRRGKICVDSTFQTVSNCNGAHALVSIFSSGTRLEFENRSWYFVNLAFRLFRSNWSECLLVQKSKRFRRAHSETGRRGSLEIKRRNAFFHKKRLSDVRVEIGSKTTFHASHVGSANICEYVRNVAVYLIHRNVYQGCKNAWTQYGSAGAKRPSNFASISAYK